jgi:hypothetical protein
MKNTLFRVTRAALILTALLSALLAAGCGNIFEEPAQRAEAAAGRGIALVSVGGETAGGRTLLPDHLALYYTLAFTKDEETETAVISNGTTGEAELGEGKWDLEVKGYLSKEDAEANAGSPAISGAADGPVEIKSGETTAVTVTLTLPSAEEGEGRVVFDLEFPGTVTGAVLSAEPLLGTKTAPAPVNLLDTAYKTDTGSRGEIVFGAGFYRLKYTLETSGGFALTRSAAVHIYKGLESPLTAAYVHGDFTEAFVAVSDITGVPESGTAGQAIDLTTAAVSPGNATNTAIVWAVTDAGGTGVSAVPDDGKVTPAAAGELKLTATVKGGGGQGKDYGKEFTVTVAAPAIGYGVYADGEVTEASGELAFYFEEAVTELSADDITLTAGTGAAVKGALSGGGTDWTLAITVQNGATPKDGGTVKVTINKAGIDAGEKTVTVYKGPALAYYYRGNEFDDKAHTGKGTAKEDWTLNVTEQSKVYFAVYKYAGKAVSVDGTAAETAKVSQAAVGSEADGLTASDELAVFTVETGDLVFDGGERKFTLNAGDAGDALAGTVNVTVKVAADKTGAAVFKLLEKKGGVEYLARVGDDEETKDKDESAFDDLVSAFTWVEENAEANTEYTIRVEKSEDKLPYLYMGAHKAENVTLRFRGDKNGPHTLRPIHLEGTGAQSPDMVNIQKFSTSVKPFISIGGTLNGYMETYPKKKFILGNNITIQGYDRNAGQENNYRFIFQVEFNGTLVLEPGSKITGHINTSYPLIQVAGTNKNTTQDPALYGKVRIEGGAITDCTTSSNRSLIRFGCNLSTNATNNVEDGAFYLAPAALTLENIEGATKIVMFNNTYYTTDSTTVFTADLVKGMSIPPAP